MQMKKKANIKDNGIYKNCQTSPRRAKLMVKIRLLTVG